MKLVAVVGWKVTSVFVPPPSVEFLAEEMFPANSQNTWMLMRSISETDRNQECLFPRCVSARLLLVCASSPWFTEHDVPPSVPGFIFSFPRIFICFPSGLAHSSSPAAMCLHTAGELESLLLLQPNSECERASLRDVDYSSTWKHRVSPRGLCSLCRLTFVTTG